MAEGCRLGIGPNPVAGSHNYNHAARGGQNAPNLAQQRQGIGALLERMDGQDAVKQGIAKRQAVFPGQRREVGRSGGPDLNALLSRHGGDDPACARTHRTQEWCRVAQTQNVEIPRIAPGLGDLARGHFTGCLAQRGGIELTEIQHVATHVLELGLVVSPREPYLVKKLSQAEKPMSITVHQFACLSDNYGFLVRDDATGLAACIDTPDATAIMAELKATGWKLALILNTHWHPDHAGGNAEIKAATGCEVVGPSEVEKLSPVDRKVVGGDVVMLGQTKFEVIESGGHTLGHIAYFDAADHTAFVGDTLFALGCGRLFEGTPAQMWDSLQRLAALPDDTKVYCAHEYTASNARFALSVDTDPVLKARTDDIFAARERGEWTVPTTIGLEKATNPFLRAPVLRPGMVPHEAFGAVRAAKDEFKG